MTDQQAINEAKKRWGNRFYVRNSKSMSSPEKRDSNREKYQKARAEIESIEDNIKQRLATLDWYVELRARQRTLRKESAAAQSVALYHRFGVGKTGSMFTEILGTGDTWEEAFAQSERK